MRIVLMLFTVVSLTGCAKDSGGPAAAAAAKSVFSLWTKSDNAFFFDTTGGSFGTPTPIAFVFSGGATCLCSLTVNGTETSGSYSLLSCTYASGGSGDPGCSSMNEAGTYSKPASSLQLCSIGTCRDYN